MLRGRGPFAARLAKVVGAAVGAVVVMLSLLLFSAACCCAVLCCSARPPALLCRARCLPACTSHLTQFARGGKPNTLSSLTPVLLTSQKVSALRCRPLSCVGSAPLGECVEKRSGGKGCRSSEGRFKILMAWSDRQVSFELQVAAAGQVKFVEIEVIGRSQVELRLRSRKMAAGGRFGVSFGSSRSSQVVWRFWWRCSGTYGDGTGRYRWDMLTSNFHLSLHLTDRSSTLS